MKRCLAGLVLVMLMIAEASAQGPRPGGPPPMAFGFAPPGMEFMRVLSADKLPLLGQKSVQDELKVTEKQRTQIDQRLDKHREDIAKLRDMESGEAEKKVAKLIQSHDTLLSKLLDPKQFKRLGQISVRSRGTRALGDADVSRALALTGKQKTAVQEILDGSREEMQKSFAQFRGGLGFRPPGGPEGPGGGFGLPQVQGAPGPRPNEGGAQQPPQGDNVGAIRNVPAPRGKETEAEREAREKQFEKIDVLRKTTDEKLLGVLTQKQLAKWEELQGESFSGEIFGPGRFGRGGPPPRGEDSPEPSRPSREKAKADK
jgi:Spy/CpxP family protein refolding chaperone